MSGVHAFLPPSGAAEWVACTLWPTMNARYPKPDTEKALEGTAAHWVWGEEFYGRGWPALGAPAPNGVAVTREMLDGGALYAHTIDADLAACGLDRRYLVVERRVAIPEVHEQNWGTPDTWFFAQHLGRLYVYDYKFGHLTVEARENWQCVDYVAGIVDELAAHLRVSTAVLDQDLIVVITVVQPRNFLGGEQVDRWTVRASDLRAMNNRLRSAAEEAVGPNPRAMPGEQCTYCPGRHACPTLQREGKKAVYLSRQSPPLDLTPEALGNELRLLEQTASLLKARITGLQEEATVRLKRGERIGQYTLEQSYGREAWAIPPEQVAAIGAMLGKTLTKVEPITPKQAIAAGVPEALVAASSKREFKGLKLVLDDGKKAAKVFDGGVKAP